MIFKRFLVFLFSILFLAIFVITIDSFASSTFPISVKDYIGINRQSHPVTTGIPFPKGALPSKNNCIIRNPSGQEVPIQTEVLATWDKEGTSVKWLLFDFQSDIQANQNAIYTIEYGTDIQRGSYSTGLELQSTVDKITVDTGPLQFSIRKDKFTFLEEVNLNGVQIIKPGQGQELSIIDQDGIVYRSSNNDTDYQVIVEDSGPLRAQIKCSGWYVSDAGDRRFQYIVRFNAYNGKPIIRIYHTFIFSEDMFKYRLKNIAIKAPLNLNDTLKYAVGGEDNIFSGNLNTNANIHLLQDDWNHYVIKNIAHEVFSEGSQSKGWLDLSDGSKGVTVFLRDMWQTYPLELEADGKNLMVHLWPLHGDYTAQVQAKKQDALSGKISHFWPFHEGQELNLAAISPGSHSYDGVNPETFFDVDYKNNAIGISKTHELIYYFHLGDYQTGNSETTVKAYKEELMGTNPQWFCNSGAFRSLHPYDPESFLKIENDLEGIFDNIVSAQQANVDYGMVHYGDAHYSYDASGSGSRYWVHYRIDWVNFPWTMYIRTGNPKYLKFGIASSRHLIDIDTVQVDSVLTDCLGNQVNRFIGGYPSGSASEVGAAHWKNEPREPGIDHGQENFFNYYYLTGYKRCKDVLNLAKQAVISKNQILPDGTIAYWGTRDVHALTLYSRLYELDWDNQLLQIANAGFKTIKDKLQIPNGIMADTEEISYSLLFSAWPPDGLDSYRFINDSEEVKNVLLKFAKAIGGMGKYDDCLGLRFFGAPFSVFNYGYELSGDDDFVSYGKHYYDIVLSNMHNLYKIGTTTRPNLPFWIGLRLPHFLKTLKNYSKEISYPDYPPTFINIQENNGVKYIIKEEIDQDIKLLFAIEVDNNDYGWQNSGNITTKIYSPDNNLILNESYTMGNRYNFQPGDTVEADPRLKYLTIPRDGKTGDYRIEFTVDKTKHTIALLSNNLNKAIISVSPDGVWLGRGRYFFYVSEDVNQFSISSPSPYWHPFTIVDPDGNFQSETTIVPSSSQKNKLWSVITNRGDSAAGISYLEFTNLGYSINLSFSPQTHFADIPLSIVTSALQDGVINTPYNSTMKASGGTAPYIWSILSGKLPDGLFINSSGVISGTPTTEGIYTFTIKLIDCSEPAQEDSKQFIININAGINNPSALASANPRSGKVPLTVNFSGSGNDIDGTIASYHWDFGDGSYSSEQNPTHIYYNPGSYIAKLTVTDNDGLSGHNSIDILVSTEESSGFNLVYSSFEANNDGWGDPVGCIFERVSDLKYQGSYSMHVSANSSSSCLSLGIDVQNWDLDLYPTMEFAYKISNGTPVGLFFLTEEGWICLGGTTNHKHDTYHSNDSYILIDDHEWHTITIKVRDKIREIYPMINTVSRFQFYTFQNAYLGNEFWFDEFKIVIAASGTTNLKIVSDRWPDTSSLKNFSESSARLMKANSDEEKAIALWRFIHQSTWVTNTIPREPAYSISYEDDPIKTLNIYGAHWCDGLSRVMEMAWRSMGYRAEKFYKWGHTLADVWWKDVDGVERWHLFDLSQSWFVYNRTGTHIASPDEIMLDYSLMTIPSKPPVPINGSGHGLWGYVHAGHLNWPSHDMSLSLRPGESFTRLWGNEGLPYHNIYASYPPGTKDFIHGPYEKTYGNGKLIYTPDFSSNSYLKGLYAASTNLTSIAEDGKSPNLHPSVVGSPGIAIFKFSIPYIIADAWINGKFIRNNPNDSIIFSISVDKGVTWRQVYEADETGTFTIESFNIAEKFDVSQSYPAGLITPFGHYEYLFKVELQATENTVDCGIEDLTIMTVIQHNILALPQLWPGENTISVTGDIAPDTSLRIAYIWDDLMGQERKNIAIIENTPYAYKIVTDGTKWEDVVCKSITIEAIERIGNGNFIELKEAPPNSIHNITPTDAFPTEKIIGSYGAGNLKTVEEYMTDLQQALAAQEGQPTDSDVVRQQKDAIRFGLLGLAAHATAASQAKDIITDVLYKDRSYGIYNKMFACQALYQVAGQGAVPSLIKVLEKDSQILWGDATNQFDEATVWLHTCAAAAAILGNIGNLEAKGAADLVANLLDSSKVAGKIGFTPSNSTIYRWGELRWAWIKALGKLGNQAHGPVLRKELLSSDVDASALAARALGEIGDANAITDLLNILSKHSYSPQGLYAIESLGKLGSPDIASALYAYLNHWDEDYRGFTAQALGSLGNKDAIPYLLNLIEIETFPWVKDYARESYKQLSGDDVPDDQTPPAPPAGLKMKILNIM